MVELNINDITGRLLDLRMYSPELSRRMEHEEELPEDAAPFLIRQIEMAFAQCEAASLADRADAFDELELWLTRSYRYYLTRLALADNPWCFRFPVFAGDNIQ